jgi:hypothetical protein
MINEFAPSGEPYITPLSRYDSLDIPLDRRARIVVSLVEDFELKRSFSSIFGNPSGLLDWLASQPGANSEILRRWVLSVRMKGGIAGLPVGLSLDGPDTRNSNVWPAVAAARSVEIYSD